MVTNTYQQPSITALGHVKTDKAIARAFRLYQHTPNTDYDSLLLSSSTHTHTHTQTHTRSSTDCQRRNRFMPILCSGDPGLKSGPGDSIPTSVADFISPPRKT
jgi:hypothetical protein